MLTRHINNKDVWIILIIAFFLILNSSAYAEQTNARSLDKLSTSELIKKAEQNDKNAQFKLGIRYADGIKTKKDNDKAIHWLRAC